MVCRVTGEVRAPVVHLERVSAPERPVPIVHEARAEVSRGRRRDAHVVDRNLLPPVQLDELANAPPADEDTEPERHDPGCSCMLARDPLHGRPVEVIIVIV
jgi:hypothetical protein